ncbi:somatostatin receptor type 4-like [Oculina patagonica]
MNNSTHISSNGDSSCPYAVSIFFTTVMAIISSAAFIGNFLVIFVVFKTPSLRTSTNYYYINMAVSDFIVSFTTWPLYLTAEIITSSGSLLEGFLATVLCKVGVFFRMVSSIVSILSLVLIAVDRFIATVFPLKVTLITQKLRATLLFGTWLISNVYCIPMFYYFRVKEVGHEKYCKFGWNSAARMIYYITGLVLFVVMPLLTIIITYSSIMRALSKRPKPEFNTKCRSQQNRNNQNKNIMKIFKSIVLAFFISYSFYCVYLILQITSPDLFIKDNCKLILGFANFVLPSLSTAINPVILFAFSTNFRQVLRMPYLCHCSFSKFRSRCKTKKVSSREESPEELVTFKKTSS